MTLKHVLMAAILMGSLNATAKDYHYTTPNQNHLQ